MVRELHLLRYPLPQNDRQVPTEVFRRGPLVGSLIFGLELGVGFRTKVTSAIPYISVAVLVLGGVGPLSAVVLGCGFAAGRFMMPLLRQISPRRDAWDDGLHARVQYLNGLGALVAVVACLSVVS